MDIFYYITHKLMHFNDDSFQYNKDLFEQVKTNPFLLHQKYYDSINKNDEQSYLIFNILYQFLYANIDVNKNIKFLELYNIFNVY